MIAKSQLDRATIELIDFYLQGSTWEEAACWMDNVSTNPKYKSFIPCHFVYFPKDKTYTKTKDENGINKLDYCMRMLQYRKLQSKETMNEIVKLIFHIIGDLHQPFHCGYPEDKVGFDYKVKFLNKESNLNAVWSDQIISEKKIDMWTCTNYLVGMNLTKKKREEVEKIDFVAWMLESRALLPNAYKITNGNIDKKYIDLNTAVIEEQLIKAGLRLASVLKMAFIEKLN